MSKISHHPRAGTGIEHHPAGARIAAHVHDDDQVVYATSGFLEITTTDGSSWFVAPDRAVLIPAGVGHGYRVHRASVMRTYGTGHVARAEETTPRFVHLNRLTRELLDAATAKTLTGDAAQHANRLIRVLLADADDASLLLPAPHDPRLARACRLIEAELGHSIPLPELASRIHLSTRQLSRLFRDELGMTYPQWRARLRVSRAATALLDDHTITTVAMRYGWTTPSSFATAFTTLVGMTPSQYQRTARGAKPA